MSPTSCTPATPSEKTFRP
uniref:Uncharacterized protein n=1 Tax=Anguilla anguilla TaxID=7936 RepID=A0A0E9XPE9_ANGAN